MNPHDGMTHSRLTSQETRHVTTIVQCVHYVQRVLAVHFCAILGESGPFLGTNHPVTNSIHIIPLTFILIQ